MKFVTSLAAVCAIVAGTMPGLASAGDQAAAPKGEAVLAIIEATATVTKIDHATRDVTLKTEDGREVSFVASEDVKNLPQVQVGDKVTVQYAEALAYEVKKGGQASDDGTVVAGEAAEPGKKPAGAIARQTVVTVLITAIDQAAPSITFKGPQGNTRTVKVQHPEKLKGVNVGDTVTLTFTEAVAIKVEETPKP